jgi:hypothetical protein
VSVMRIARSGGNTQVIKYYRSGRIKEYCFVLQFCKYCASVNILDLICIGLCHSGENLKHIYGLTLLVRNEFLPHRDVRDNFFFNFSAVYAVKVEKRHIRFVHLTEFVWLCCGNIL